jgi:hypothetical protein
MLLSFVALKKNTISLFILSATTGKKFFLEAEPGDIR